MCINSSHPSGEHQASDTASEENYDVETLVDFIVWEPLQLGDPGNNYVCTVSDWLKMRGWNEKLCYLFFPRRDRMKLEHDYFPPFFEMKGNEEWDIRQLCLGFLWPSVSPSLWSLWPYEFTLYVCVYICLYVYIYILYLYIFFLLSMVVAPYLDHFLSTFCTGFFVERELITWRKPFSFSFIDCVLV